MVTTLSEETLAACTRNDVYSKAIWCKFKKVPVTSCLTWTAKWPWWVTVYKPSSSFIIYTGEWSPSCIGNFKWAQVHKESKPICSCLRVLHWVSLVLSDKLSWGSQHTGLQQERGVEADGASPSLSWTRRVKGVRKPFFVHRFTNKYKK